MARLALAFAFNGACGFGGVFSIRLRTSSRESVGVLGMAKPNEFGFTPKQEKSADDAFHLQLGHTLVEWAGVEHQIFLWFWLLSTISDIPKSIRNEHLRCAQQNWYALKHVLWGVREPLKAKYPATLEEGHRRLALLPTWAHEDRPALTPEEKKLRKKASRARRRKPSKRELRKARKRVAQKNGG